MIRPNIQDKKKKKQIEYTSFFNEESMNQHLKGLEESLNEDSCLLTTGSQRSLRKKNLLEGNEDRSEESFEMEEDEEKIDLPFQEDELYSNILMEFLPRLKQEIVADKVMKKKTKDTNPLK
jgi:hypothetical protein